jgi:hypothetical protein
MAPNGLSRSSQCYYVLKTTYTYFAIDTQQASIPDMQWAQVLYKNGDSKSSYMLLCLKYDGYLSAIEVQYKQIPVQKPGPDEVLVNIKFSGVCHTYDIHL